MATATKKSTAPPPPDRAGPAGPTLISAVPRAFDAVYRFFASLKLAVLSLGTLAAVLSYATFFEKWYGTAAVQEWIYQSKGFAILLAFLAANILCAALIRYPWKRRQTGFVVTHAGLLVLLAGSWYSVRNSDEGQVAALEGEVKDELVRNDFPVVRIEQVDPEDPAQSLHAWALDFRPGAFGWGPGQPRPRSVLGSLVRPFTGDDRRPEEVLTKPKDPFRFVVKSHIPASMPAVRHEADPAGSPMAKIRPTFKAPGMPKGRDVFGDDDRWFLPEKRLFRVVKKESPTSGPMPASFAFNYVDRPELVDEFLNPPADPGNDGVARFRYQDKAGKARSHDWPLDGQAGKSLTLPDSDLSVKFIDVMNFPAASAGLGRTLGEASVPIVEFEVSQGGKAPVKHFALAMLPMFPNVIPGQGQGADAHEPPRPLVNVSYYLPPALDPKSNGQFGMVEVLGTADGSLYYRVFGRGAPGQTRGQVRSRGPLAKGKEVVAFGGNANMPMTIAFEVEDYLPSGVEKSVCEPVVLPAGQTGNGIAASLVEMTVTDPDHPSKQYTKEFYIRRSATFDPVWQTVTFPTGSYRIAYDGDRKPLGFELKMVDFQRGFDPGTEKASRFSSDVVLTDKSMGVNGKPVHIAMNEPLTHRGYTFYQSSFVRQEDPRTGRETGRETSVLQVGLNPGRPVMYSGCLLVVLGAFLQFYMRAGVFTDGGKREREKARAKAIKDARASGRSVDHLLVDQAPAVPATPGDADEAL